MNARPTNVVIDTNVVLSAMNGSKQAMQLLLAAEKRQITLISSAKLHWELQEVLSERRPGLTDITPDRRQLVETILDRAGRIRRDPPLRNPVPLSSDRDDDFVVALAQSTGAVLITGDKRLLESLPPDLARATLREAATCLATVGSIPTALAGRNGMPLLALN